MSLIDQIIGVESGGRADAKNPRSSASGLGQFIDSTWETMLAKHRPDLVQGKTREEILALKSDPQLSRAMTEAYAADNGQILQSAGLPVTPASTYLAHFAGPQGAVKVLGANPSAPVESILGAGAVKANPFLKGMTAADLQAWAGRKMGQPAPSSAPQTQTAARMPVSQPAPAPVQSPVNAAPTAISFGVPGSAPAPQQSASLLDSLQANQSAMGGPLQVLRPRADLSKLLATFQPRQFGGVFYS